MWALKSKGSVGKTVAAAEEHGCSANIRKMCGMASESPAQTSGSSPQPLVLMVKQSHSFHQNGILIFPHSVES